MTTTLRLLAMVFAAASSLCALSPLWTLAQETLASGFPVAYRFSVLEAAHGRAKVNVTLTYMGSVPIHHYTLTIDPKCPGCTPGRVKGDFLGRGDTVSMIVELASPLEDVRVEFEGYAAGLYRFKVSVQVGVQLGG